MGETRMNNDLKIITSRIDLLFTRKSKTRYWLQVANDTYDQTFNFFFLSQRPYQRLRCRPIHTVTNYDLGNLETLITDVNQAYKLTIDYTQFYGLRWPRSQRLIQKRRHSLE